MRDVLCARRRRTGDLRRVERELRVDPALSVGDAEEACVAPAQTPAVLADPATLVVVVADDRDRVVSTEVAGDVPVDAAGYAKKSAKTAIPATTGPASAIAASRSAIDGSTV
jgi:hypothetical protein